MTWLNDSIMRRRGVAQGRTPDSHALTEALQGKFHYTIGPYSDPVLKIRPGDRVVVDTRDAFDGQVKTEQDLPSRVLNMPFVNPQNGPILVEGAEKGDVLAVYIESMAPRGPNPRGTCAMIPQFGALSGTSLTALLAQDLPDMGPGSITYLPVRSAGGRLFIGDAHACQGDGEVCGTAVEYASTTTIQVDLIKGWQLDWPWLENEKVIMAIGSARPLEDATRIAYKELILWLEADYGYDRWDAYMMLSQCGQVRLGNFVDPKYTVGAGISKQYLAPA